MKFIKPLLLSVTIAFALFNCGGTAEILSTPVENIDNTPIKVTELTEAEKRNWGHLDLISDTIPGMSLDRAYAELIKGRKGATTIVAVIDSGIDIDHEDLDDVIWKNKDEIPNNGKDDDKNGYIDDVHGWNFLGDTYHEQLEYVRLLASGNSGHPRFAEARAELEKNYNQALSRKSQYEQILQQVEVSDEAIAKHLNKKDYSREDVNAIQTEDPQLLQHKSVIQQTYGFGFGSISETIKQLKDGITHFTEQLNYHYNLNFNGRKTADDPNDFSQKVYGNNKVSPIGDGEDHGTHVAGIIAMERANGKGADGVANNVKIMALRTVPNGDEYDKDVALAIRYAVDNGAKVINMSFGKYYSPNKEWVMDAIKYAGQKDVLIIAGAGNEALNLDNKNSFPNDSYNNGAEVSNTYLSVGALEPKYGSGMVAGYSNFGKMNVDVFAPGSMIYSSVPKNDYRNMQGTSMAAPAVAGIAALIRSQYPNLTAAQVKQILMDSGLAVKAKVVVGGDAADIRPFDALSKSGKMVNAYNALIMAARMANK